MNFSTSGDSVQNLTYSVMQSDGYSFFCLALISLTWHKGMKTKCMRSKYLGILNDLEIQR